FIRSHGSGSRVAGAAEYSHPRAHGAALADSAGDYSQSAGARGADGGCPPGGPGHGARRGIVLERSRFQPLSRIEVDESAGGVVIQLTGTAPRTPRPTPCLCYGRLPSWRRGPCAPVARPAAILRARCT